MSIVFPTEDTNVLRLINDSFSKPTHNTLLNDFSLDKELSNDDVKVYLDKNKNVYVVNRATNLKNPKTRYDDLKSDIAVAFGQEHYNKRFQDAKAHIEQVEMKYPHSTNIYNGGYSLGGAVANFANQHCKSGKCSAITFNKGATPFSNKGSSNSRNYYSSGDVLSNGGILFSRGNQIVKPSVIHNKHSLANFKTPAFKNNVAPINVA